LTRSALPEVVSYHVHLYFDGERGVERARRIRDELMTRFGAAPGTWRDEPGGPHPSPVAQVTLDARRFGEAVTWLMFNRSGLDVLVHPETGDAVADHGERALWLGDKQPLLFDAM
jgi:DOPA 4,5-dioxygenase